jgi:hypothetical protein
LRRPPKRRKLGAVSRLHGALLAAVALHCALYAVGSFYESQRPAPRAATRPLEVEVDWIPPPAQLAPLTEPLPEPTPSAPTTAPPARVAAAAAPSIASPSTDDGTGVELESQPVASGVDTGPSIPNAAPGPKRRIDLGLDGKMFAVEAGTSLQLPGRVDPSRQLNRSLANGAAASDVSRGLARGGVLVSSVRSVARLEGPETGSAVIQIQVDASGVPVGVRLLQGGNAEWDRVLRRLRAQLRQQRLRVPQGAAGLMVTLAVQSKVQRPSGQSAKGPAADVEMSPLETTGSFDLSDLSGSVQRIVAARILSEEVL